jgi:hypothetical protein
MNVSHDSHYDHEVAKHDPQEGFDPTEPHAQRITFFVIASIITLVVVILALQNYFESVWDKQVYEKVLTVAPPELRELRALEAWRMSHYEFTTEAKTEVRIPLERARDLVLQDAAQGKTFYPAKATVPVPEQPPAPADAKQADAKQADAKSAEAKK